LALVEAKYLGCLHCDLAFVRVHHESDGGFPLIGDRQFDLLIDVPL
jgi:hypothetical protein